MNLLESFPLEFQQGMAARAAKLSDVGESAPEHWEAPLGSPDVHVVLAVLAPDTDRFESLVAKARERIQGPSRNHALVAPGCPLAAQRA